MARHIFQSIKQQGGLSVYLPANGWDYDTFSLGHRAGLSNPAIAKLLRVKHADDTGNIIDPPTQETVGRWREEFKTEQLQNNSPSA